MEKLNWQVIHRSGSQYFATKEEAEKYASEKSNHAKWNQSTGEWDEDTCSVYYSFNGRLMAEYTGGRKTYFA